MVFIGHIAYFAYMGIANSTNAVGLRFNSQNLQKFSLLSQKCYECDY